MKKQKAFTLIELLAVIGIIGFLSSIVLVATKGAREKAQRVKVLQFSAQVYHVLGAYVVGMWDFEENGDNTCSPTEPYNDICDRSGNNNHGLRFNATWVTGGDNTPSGTGYALSFDGNGDYVDLGNPPSLQLTKNQTIEMWLYPTSFSARRNPYAKAYGGEGTITQEINGRVNYYYGTCGGNCSPYQGFTMTSPLSLNTWVHLVLVRDLTNMKLYWYKNGVLVNPTNASYLSAVVSSLPARIGKGYVSDYAGLID